MERVRVGDGERGGDGVTRRRARREPDDVPQAGVQTGRDVEVL